MNAIILKKDHTPWNKGKLIGQKSPLKLKEIWAIRIRLQLANKTRELALFNLAIDSKLRACDLVQLRLYPAMKPSIESAQAWVDYSTLRAQTGSDPQEWQTSVSFERR